MGKTPLQPQDKYVLRFPDGLRERIKAAAKENGRSMNAEIIATLTDAYPQPLSVSDLIKETKRIVASIRKTRSAASLVELHNVLAEAEHELTAIDRTRSDEDDDPRS